MLISFSELRIAFGASVAEWSGRSLPEFNADLPSKRPEHVIVEVRESDGTDSTYNRLGFYRLNDVTPEDAEDLLDAMRERQVAGRAAHSGSSTSGCCGRATRNG